MRRGLLVLALAACAAGCGRPAPEVVRIAAAASTREAVERVAADFRAETGVPVEPNFGPTSALAHQIEQGGDVDLFLSADEAWADEVAKQQLVAERRDLLTNRLVVIVPAAGGPQLGKLDDLAGPAVRRLALAGEAVPAGRYARQALKQAKVWDRVEARVLGSGDVRAALAHVARGEADAGLVYATDAQDARDVRVAFEVPAELHQPIRYPLVLLRREPVQVAARRFYAYLASDKARAVFREAGFGVLP